MRRNEKHIFQIIHLLLEAPHGAPAITSLAGASSDEFRHAAWLLESRGLVVAQKVDDAYSVSALTWSGYDYADAHKTYLKKIAAEL